MNFVDGALITVMLLSMWGVWRTGFIIAASDLLKWLLSLFAGFVFYKNAAHVLQQYFPSLSFRAAPFAFLIIILLARILLSLLLNFLVRLAPQEVHFSAVNRLLGITPGFVNGLIAATIITLLLLAYPVTENISNETENSKLAARLTPPGEWLSEKLSPVFSEAIQQTITKLTVEPKSNETIKLSYTKSNPKVRADLEVNAAISKSGKSQSGIKAIES